MLKEAMKEAAIIFLFIWWITFFKHLVFVAVYLKDNVYINVNINVDDDVNADVDAEMPKPRFLNGRF